MRIARLDLIRYGRFADTVIEFPRRDTDLHIVFGRNEAGKTTARAAIGDLLFGFGHTSPYSFRFESSELRVGALLESGDRTLALRRRKGRANTLVGADDKPLPEAQLTGFLGGRTREFFERQFSLDQAGLVKGGRDIVEARDDLGRMLFQSAAGLGDLGAALERLEGEAELLWAPRRAANRVYFRAADRLQEAEKALKEYTLRASAYHDAVKQHEEALQSARQLEDRGRALRAEESRLRRIQTSLPRLAERAALLQQLVAMGEVSDLPEDAAARLTEARELMTRAEESLRLLRATQESRTGELNAISVDQALLAAEPEISRLQVLKAQYSAYPRDIPRREGEIQAERAGVDKLVAELGWSRADPGELMERLPGRLATSRLHGLAQAYGSVAAKVEGSKSALEKLRSDNAVRAEKLARLPEAMASPTLAVALERAGQIGAAGTRHGELSREVEQAEVEVTRAMAALHPWEGTPATLAALVPPSRARLGALRTQIDAVQSACRQAAEAARQKAQELAEAELRVEQVRRDGRPVSGEELAVARAARQAAWMVIRTGLESGDLQSSQQGIAPFEAEQQSSDELADRRFDRAAESAALSRAIQEVERLRLVHQAALDHVGERQATLSPLLAELKGIQEALGLAAATAQEIESWIRDREAALEKMRLHEKASSTLGAFEGHLDQAIKALRDALGDAAATISGHKQAEFASLLRRATELQREEQALREERRLLEQQLQDGERNVAVAERQLGEALSALQEWQAQWAGSCKVLGFEKPLAVEQAAKALELLQELEEALKRISEIQTNRIDAMKRDLDAFANDVSQVARAVAADLLALPPSEVLDRLGQRLAEAKKSEQDRQRLTQEIRDNETKIAEANARLNDAVALVAPLLTLATVEDLEALRGAVERSQKRRQLQQEIGRLERDLLESGDGLSIAQLQDEAASHDRDQLSGRLVELEAALGQLGTDQQEVGGRVQSARNALQQMQGTDAALRAAEARQEALAEMGSAVRRWSRLTVGIRLVRAAMERYRESKQVPLLKRAQVLFAALTLDEFKSLRVDYGREDHPVLLAIRRNEEAVPLDGLSTGTADQLYLALRIAALEESLTATEALPFVVDDLFVNFDDERSAAGLKVLADLSRKTQVLFFTHHAHILRVSEQALGQRYETRLGI